MLKKKYIILYVMFLIVLSSFVCAVEPPIACWSFDDTLADSEERFPKDMYMGAGVATYVTGKVGSALVINSEDQYAENTSTNDINWSNVRTVSTWVNMTSADAGRFYFALGGGTNIIVLGAEQGKVLAYGIGGSDDITVSGLVAGKWYHIVAVYGIGGKRIYLNGTLIFDEGASTNTPANDNDFVRTMYNLIQDSGVKGAVDEIGLYVEEWELEDVVSNYNEGNGESCMSPFAEEGIPAKPTIVAPSPPDNAINNTNVTLNVTHSTNINDVRYYLYFGDTTPLTETHLILNNVTRNGSEYSTWTTGVTDGVYYWKYKVQNITNGAYSINTTERTWTLDTTNPTITILSNNNWKTDNSTIINSYLNNLTINISFFDNNIYKTLINITNESGQTAYSILNETIIGTTVNNSGIVDISDWALGKYTIRIEAVDSHTVEQIAPYDVKNGINYFRYTTKEGNIIKIKSDTLPLTKKTTKLKDRYDFEFNYLFQEDTYKFTIESYNKIIYLENSKETIGPHFIIISENNIGNWIDFENPNLNKKDYKVIKIDDYEYEIEITANGLKSFTFNSLGGLNKAEEHYSFEIGAVIDIWIFDEENPGVQINATATIGEQSNTSIINISPATLVNITKDITIVNLSSIGFGEENKSISITLKYHNLSFNMTPVLATRISFLDENSETLITGETFSVFLEKTGFSNTYTGITNNPHTITGLEEGSYELKASSVNYQEREYKDLNISNITTTFLNVYLINTTLGQEVTFTVQGSGGNALDNADIDFFRVINGTSTIIAKENTDYAGKAKLFLDPNYEYNINFVKDGYISRNITLEPSDTEYTIILLGGELPYESVYAGVRFRFYHNGIMSISPPDILNLTNTTQNITFEVEGADIAEIGINFTHHNYVCTPASCSVTLAGEGKVKLGILLNESGTFNTAYYFQKTGEKRIYVNDGLIKVISFIFASLDSLPDWIKEMKGELSPNMRTILVAMLNVIAVGIGSSLGLAGTALIIPVLAVNVICSLPEIGLIHPFIGMIISIFGVVIYVYAQSR